MGDFKLRSRSMPRSRSRSLAKKKPCAKPATAPHAHPHASRSLSDRTHGHKDTITNSDPDTTDTIDDI
jgi:hypothetical protein